MDFKTVCYDTILMPGIIDEDQLCAEIDAIAQELAAKGLHKAPPHGHKFMTEAGWRRCLKKMIRHPEFTQEGTYVAVHLHGTTTSNHHELVDVVAGHLLSKLPLEKACGFRSVVCGDDSNPEPSSWMFWHDGKLVPGDPRSRMQLQPMPSKH